MHIRSAETTWAEEEKATLREMWPTGVSALEIAIKIGRSEGAVRKKAQKMHLQSRNSPLGGRPRGIPSTSADGLRALLLAQRVSLQRKPHDRSAVKAAMSLPIPPPRSCQWIEGDVKPQPQFCGCATLRGKSWCKSHYRRVYQPMENAL